MVWINFWETLDGFFFHQLSKLGLRNGKDGEGVELFLVHPFQMAPNGMLESAL